MRGEDMNSSKITFVTSGSPPHARGRHGIDVIYGVPSGITPACAGKTAPCQTALHGHADHPRMRGEDLQKIWVGDFDGGITPACAGKTPSPSYPMGSGTDHPRMRGEDAVMPIQKCVDSGSPPHARGRLLAVPHSHKQTGITPACAGKTTHMFCGKSQSRDHPRMRGEDFLPSRVLVTGRGSPPHARGRRSAMANCHGLTRITPACAGKTAGTYAAMARNKDHPRMRGEDSANRLPRGRIQGSPPHARGRHTIQSLLKLALRITPACAGKTYARLADWIAFWDHPRMRGEDSAYPALRRFVTGSPPHARGRLSLLQPRAPRTRITPACAGKT